MQKIYGDTPADKMVLAKGTYVPFVDGIKSEVPTPALGTDG